MRAELAERDDDERLNLVAAVAEDGIRQVLLSSERSRVRVTYERLSSKARPCAGLFSLRLRSTCSAPSLSEQGIKHLADELLLGLGQGLYAFELPLELGCRPALAGAAPDRRANGFFDANAEPFGQGGQRSSEQTQPPSLVVCEGLLGDTEVFGQLRLGSVRALCVARRCVV